MARRTGITVRHCQCRKKCVENGSRVCADNCSHPNRYQVRKRYWCDKADCKPCDRAREKGSTKAPQHSHWFPSETEAKGFLFQLNVDAIRPKSADERSRMRLEDAFPEWHKEHSLTLRPYTANMHRRIWRVHLEPALGRKFIGGISRDDVQALVVKWHQEGGEKGNGAAPSSIRNRLNVLLPLLKWGGNVITRDDLRIPKDEKDGVVSFDMFLETDQLKTIVAALPDKYRLPVTFMAMVGTRVGETVDLRVKDILNGQRMSVSRSATKVPLSESPDGDGWKVEAGTSTKSGRSRVVWVPPALIEAVRADKDRPNELLFPDDNGKRLNYFQMNKTWKRTRQELIDEGKLPAEKAKVRMHDLRHTCASMLADKGASILVVAQQLGHADPSITARIYAHIFPSAVDALMGALDEDVNEVLR